MVIIQRAVKHSTVETVAFFTVSTVSPTCSQ